MRSLLLLPRIFALTTLVVFASLSTGARAADRDAVQGFLKTTGFDAALEGLQFSASAAPILLGMEEDDFGADWTRMVKEVFDPPLMHEMALDILEQTLSDDHLAHASAFYASDLGRRLVEIENQSHREEDDEDKDQAGQELVADMVRNQSPRLEALRRMNAAVDPQGIGVKALQEVQYRFLLAASAAGVIDLQIDADELRARLRSQERNLRLNMQKSALSNAAYTYRSFSDEDIEAYADALEQDEMKSVYELMNAVQFTVMSDRFEELAKRMADLRPVTDL